MTRYDTLVQALEGLRAQGYTHNFNVMHNCLHCSDDGRRLNPDEFEITEVHRFEGMSNPDDNTVLYAIESHDGLKGVFVNAYGVYADPISEEMIAKLSVHEH